MERTTIDFGIDLGTTNSVLSVVNGGEIETVKNGISEITPSVVYFDKRGVKRVGTAAADMLARVATATDVQFEFKRVMGQRVEREFKSAGKRLTPEELSAEVLSELRRAAAVRFGSEPAAAVITVPAMFELPQNEATAHAAKLAGFTHSQLLQEPVAAAVAYGFQTDAEKAHWIVYDYGGGTFDVSIIAIRDGQLRVIKHAGDNYLGGADLDWKIVEECMVPNLADAFTLSSLARGPKARDVDNGRMLVLKRHAENIKKMLSNQERVEYFEENVFTDDDGKPVDLECTVTREEFEQLAGPAVERSIDIVHQLIQDSGVPKASLDRFILVGGSTFIPLVRRKTAALGIPIAMDIDPMVVVSRGAAVFASSQRLPSSRAKPVAATAGTATVQLEYESVAKETSPYVGGKLEIDGKAPLAGTTVLLQRDDNGWNSGAVAVDPKGMFFTTVQIREKGQSVFSLQVRDAGGQNVPCTPSSLAITYGLSIASAPLPAGCGIALADGTAEILIKGGTRLPCPPAVYAGKFVRGLRKGADEKLRVPVLSGDEASAEHNLVGTIITISGKDISRDIPAGSDVEIEISIDSQGVPQIQAFVPLLDETFRPSERIEMDFEKPAIMRERVASIRARLEKVESDADEANLDTISSEASQLAESDQFDEIERLLKCWDDGDSVAAGQARSLIVDLAKRASALAERVDFPVSESEYKEALDFARKVAAEYGDAADKRALDELAREGERARTARDVKMLRHCTEQIQTIKIQLLRKDPAFWVSFLAHLHQQQDRFNDRAAARRLFAEGAAAAQRRDIASLESVVQQLLRMLPREVAHAVQSGIGSDVM
jgi:molecular chaperone DnaK